MDGSGALERLTLVRHGQQEPPRHDGDPDAPLTARGAAQAEAAVPVIVSRGPYQALFVSPFRRARETAAPAARALGLEPVGEPGLREFLLAPEGASSPEGYARAHQLAKDHFESAPAGGESVRGFHARVAGTLDRLVEEHPGQSLLLVAHGGVIKMAFLHLMGIPLERSMDMGLQIDHAGLFQWSSRMVEGRRRWRLVVANVTA